MVIDKRKFVSWIYQINFDNRKCTSILDNFGNIPDKEELLAINKWTEQFKTVSQKAINQHNKKRQDEWRERQKIIEKNRKDQEAIFKQKDLPGWVYVIENQGFYKIGKAKDLKSRIKSYITENPLPLNIIATYKVNNRTLAEQYLLTVFSPKQHRGEWHNLTSEDLQTIPNLLKEYI